MDYKEFVSKDKSMLIAPAGYGKTHAIVKCLPHSIGKQLILTHTHAGIASIKEKMSKANIPLSVYHIETITSYAQKYVLAFYNGNDIPEQKNSKEYYPFIVSKATELLKLKPILSIVNATYSGLFIDEYQDCTSAQHNLILILSNTLPTRILGDHLQGIFNFTGEVMVDLNNRNDMGEFLNHTYELTEPKRWEKTNPGLGSSLKAIRLNIESKINIDLNEFSSIETIIANESDLFIKDSAYRKRVLGLLNSEESLLIIHPESTNINPRKKIIQTFSNRLTLVEAIDDKDFYGISEELDSCTTLNVEKVIRDNAYHFFDSTTLSTWFNENGLKRKTQPKEIEISKTIKDNIEVYKSKPSLLTISKIFKQIRGLQGIKCYRRELFAAINNSLEYAHYNNISIYEAMIIRRNQTRRMGRKIFGKCIGTTLLTKGLEFETVVILNAHKFECSKNLYVALTRAKTKLIVFSENQVLSPY